MDYVDLRENQIDNGRVNIFMAAFTTCWACLKLYSYLDQLKQQVLYFDTDSVVYSCKPSQADIPLGNYLGDMTNELDVDNYIVDFTSARPKNYGYKTKLGKVCCKVRGLTLNVRSSQQLNYDVMRENLLEELTNQLDQRRNIPVSTPTSSLVIPPANRSEWDPAPNSTDWSLINVSSIARPSSPTLTVTSGTDRLN